MLYLIIYNIVVAETLFYSSDMIDQLVGNNIIPVGGFKNKHLKCFFKKLLNIKLTIYRISSTE